MFDMMLEPNKKMAEFMKKDPVFGKTIRSGGYRFAWRLKEAACREKRILSEKTWNPGR